jgi:exopolyphosphatase/guanosine-5'-triphosphate,3'-diphosphate pyrophosphatase
MENKRYGAIDIGTNAVRLMIKKVTRTESGNDLMQKELLLRVPLRLGLDVFGNECISDKQVHNIRRLMKSYKHLLKIYNVDSYRACATSAMRDAKNGKEIIKMIRKECGIEIEILNGQEEAGIMYNNHTEHLGARKGNLMYVDVGGGSTEINLISDGYLVLSKSFDIGTLRLLTNKVSEATWQLFRDEITMITSDLSKIEIVGSGGNINKTYKIIPTKDKRKQRVTVKAVQTLYDTIKPLSIIERMEKFDLKADRADVIEPAMQIFLTIASIVRAEHIYIPQIGLVDGIIDALFFADKKEYESIQE